MSRRPSLPGDATVQVVVGECDRTGATAPAITRIVFPAGAFPGGTMRHDLQRQGGRYIRVEVYDSSGVLLGTGNPLWLLPAGDDVEIPAARRLVLTPVG